MIRIIFLPLVLFLSLPSPVHSQDAAAAADGSTAAEVALVTSLSGSAVRISAAEEHPLELGGSLQAGDEVHVKSGNAALVFLRGDYLSLEAGERLTLGTTLEESRIVTGGDTRGLAVEDGLSVAEEGVDPGSGREVWQSQLATVSSIRADAGVITVAPRLTISDPNPLFTWFDTDTSAAGTERSYTLGLYDAKGALIAQQQVRGTTGALNSFRFPQAPRDFLPEARRHYSWILVPAGTQLPAGPQDASFVFVDQAGLEAARAKRAQLEELQRTGRLDISSLHMLLSRYYLDERERLFADAIPHLIALDALSGGSTYVREQLAGMFLRFGNQVSTLAPRILRSTVKIGTP
ncbi:MAG: hypothetical protein JXA28_03600 [Bacteroidetes bacterium]|nr:hypothetical protein [Bacteroidota bacterium]